MGRSLTPGSEYTVFALPQGVYAGTNICYEDVYAEISRAFVRRGANVLMTLTNDAWYAESSGSRQHMVHAVFRAVENRRPLFRAGNNSDTCLILPDGRVTGQLRDPATGSAFMRGARLYRVPVWREPGFTFYTRHGDLFAHSCALATLVLGLAVFGSWLRRKHTLLQRVSREAGENRPADL